MYTFKLNNYEIWSQPASFKMLPDLLTTTMDLYNKN